MANKPNPLLAALQNKMEAEFDVRQRSIAEIDNMALLISAHRKLKVGPGRASGLLEEFIDVKKEIATAIKEDVGESYKKKGEDGDPEFLHTKRNLAVTLKGILGPEAWEEQKYRFPMVREYWDV